MVSNSILSSGQLTDPQFSPVPSSLRDSSGIHSSSTSFPLLTQHLCNITPPFTALRMLSKFIYLFWPHCYSALTDAPYRCSNMAINLNESKTEIILFGKPSLLNDYSITGPWDSHSSDFMLLWQKISKKQVCDCNVTFLKKVKQG